MARSMIPELIAASKATNRTPAFKVKIRNRTAGLRRPKFVEWYSGSENADEIVATSPSDGSLIRVRLDAGTLYYNRVTTPTIASDYTQWTNLRTGVHAIAICSDGANVEIYYVLTGDKTKIYERTSSNNGASLSSETLIITHSEDINYIACDRSVSDVVIVVPVGTRNMRAYKYTGTWSAGVDSTDGTYNNTGIAVYFQGDWDIIVTGTTVAGDSEIATRIFGQGFSQAINTWSTNRPMPQTGAVGSGLAFTRPFISQPDTFRVIFREQFTGTGAYARLSMTSSPLSADFALSIWREPHPLDIDNADGGALAFTSSFVWLVTPSKVWAMDLGVADVDVTDDLVKLIINESDSRRPETSMIVLDNSAGTYDVLGSGVNEAIVTGSDIQFALGWVVADGAKQVSSGPSLTIDKIEHDRQDGGHDYLLLHLVDNFTLLQRFKSTHTTQGATGDKNIFGQCQRLIGLIGVELASIGSSVRASDFYPAFQFPAGTSGLALLNSTLRHVPDIIWARGELCFLSEPEATDTLNWTLVWQGVPGTDYAIERARYIERSKSSHVRVLGGAQADIVGEDIDFDAVDRYFAAIEIISDRSSLTATDAADLAKHIGRHNDLSSREDILHIAPIPGLEVNDVVAITDSRQGFTAEKRRVRRLQIRYDNSGRELIYAMVITLSAL